MIVDTLEEIRDIVGRYVTSVGLSPYSHPAFSCASEDALKQCLQTESAEATADWRRVNWLREWVYRHVPDASFSRCLDAGDPAVHGASTSTILRRLADERRGFKCAGSALVLFKLCTAFGYRAAVYNAGDPAGSRASHSVTLVELFHRGWPRWTVVDPYFNHSLETRDGEPIDVRAAIDLLARSRVAEIRIAGRRRRRLMLMTPADEVRIRRLRAARARLVPGADGVLFCTRVMTVMRWMRDHPEVAAWLADRAGTRHPLFLLLFPLNIHGDEAFRTLPDYVNARRLASGR